MEQDAFRMRIEEKTLRNRPYKKRAAIHTGSPFFYRMQSIE
jgi:hypothetical protein